MYRQVRGRNFKNALLATVPVAFMVAAVSPVRAADPTPQYAIDDRIDQIEAELQRLREERVQSGNRQVDLKVYGQVNRGVLAADDGIDSELIHVDNDHSSTRVGWQGTASINEYWSAGAKIEVQFESNSTASVSLAGDTNGIGGTERVGPNNFTERKLEFWLDYMINDNSRARMTVGQGDTASNGTSEMDVSGTGVIAYSGVADTAGGIRFRQPGVGNTFSGVTVGSVFSQLDGFSRDDRIRFDYTNGPVMVSYSNIANGRNDIALRYQDTINDTFKVAAAIAYGMDTDGSRNNESPADPSATERNGETETINGSISIRHIQSGFSVTAAAGNRERSDPVPGFDFNPSLAGVQGPEDRMFYYGKFAWQGLLFDNGIGDTAFAIDAFQTENAVVPGDEGTVFGIAMVQDIDAAAMELYIGYRHHTYEAPGFASFNDIDVVLAGGRVKF